MKWLDYLSSSSSSWFVAFLAVFLAYLLSPLHFLRIIGNICCQDLKVVFQSSLILVVKTDGKHG